jgi:hypothetical protein
MGGARGLSQQVKEFVGRISLIGVTRNVMAVGMDCCRLRATRPGMPTGLAPVTWLSSCTIVVHPISGLTMRWPWEHGLVIDVLAHAMLGVADAALSVVTTSEPGPPVYHLWRLVELI